MWLAFSVAAHPDPGILLVDEVLAVGDVEFQKKCLGKMEEVASEGRTVLFVSHNMNVIEQICKRCILLERGRVIQNSSNMSQTIRDYLFPSVEEVQSSQWMNDGNGFENPWFKPYAFFISDSFANPLSNSLPNDQNIWIQIEGSIDKQDPALETGYLIHNEENVTPYLSYFNDHEVSDWPNYPFG